MGSCLGNLAQLYLRQGKVFKALGASIKSINILEEHLEQLNGTKNKGQMKEDVVVFVNSLLTTSSILRRILATNKK